MRNALKGVKLIPKMRVSKAFETEGDESEPRLNTISIEGTIEMYFYPRVIKVFVICKSIL